MLLLLLLQVVQGLLLRGHQGLRARVQGFWGLAFRAARLGFREGQELGSVSAPCRVPGVAGAVQAVRLLLLLLLLQPPPLPLLCPREVVVRRLLATAAAVPSLVRQQWRLLLLAAAAVRSCLLEWRLYMQPQRRQYNTCLRFCTGCRLARLVLPVGRCMRC